MISKWHLQDDYKIGRPKGYRKQPEIIGTKRCCRCKLTKLTHHFSKDKSRNDGLEVRCSSCSNRKVKSKLRAKGIKERNLIKLFGSDF
jgi:hypothetical protein